jgi:hypothetical protein
MSKRAWVGGSGVVVLFASVLIVVLSAPALAQSASSGDSDAQIVINGRLDVPSGRTDSTGVLFNGTANVAGTLTGALVVFNGDVTISGTVRKDVVVFNGKVTLQPGATVGGDLVSREHPQIANGATVRGDVKGVSGAYNVEGYAWVGHFVWWLGYSISTLILGLLILALWPRFDVAIAERAVTRVGAAFGFGALFFFLLPIAAVLLIAIVVGIALGLFLLLGLALIYTVGYVAGAQTLGRIIMKPPRSRYVAFLVGWGILRVVALIPVLGGVAWIVAALFGLGALFVATRERRRVDPMLVRPDTGRPITA